MSCSDLTSSLLAKVLTTRFQAGACSKAKHHQNFFQNKFLSKQMSLIYMYMQRWLHLLASSASPRGCDPAHEESATSVYFRLNILFVIVHCQFVAKIPMVVCTQTHRKRIRSNVWQTQRQVCTQLYTERAWVYRHRSCDSAHHHHHSPCHCNCL